MTDRITNIDGKEYIITECMSCPFYDRGDDGYGDKCKYLERASDNPYYGSGLPDDCPLKHA